MTCRNTVWNCVLLCIVSLLALACTGCGGIRCTRTVRWMVDPDGRKSVVTEWQESYGWGTKPPAGWAPEAAMTPVPVPDMSGLPLLPFDWPM